jgi:hypothetical protein
MFAEIAAGLMAFIKAFKKWNSLKLKKSSLYFSMSTGRTVKGKTCWIQKLDVLTAVPPILSGSRTIARLSYFYATREVKLNRKKYVWLLINAII